MKFSFDRGLVDYTKVQLAISAVIRNRRIQYSPKLLQRRYLNVGCGPAAHAGFINLDYHWQPGIDLCWDISHALPFPDACLDGVYSEHCLEHLSYDDALFAMSELRRVLRRGALARIVVPDAELFMDLYIRRRSGEQVQFPYVDSPRPNWTPIMSINRIFRGHGHQFAYDAETLIATLLRAGFSDARRESYRRGRDAHLLIDTEDRAVESLYVEAVA